MRFEKITRVSVLLALLFGTTPAAADSGWTPKPDQVARLEKKLVLPSGASPLTKYRRYYWGVTARSGKVIYGSLLSLGRKPGLVIANHPPGDSVQDGGCGVISVAYDLSQDSVSAWCNGLA